MVLLNRDGALVDETWVECELVKGNCRGPVCNTEGALGGVCTGVDVQ